MEGTDRQLAAIDIRSHILNCGARKWRQVRAKHAAIPEATWWRLVKSVREEFICISSTQARLVTSQTNSVRAKPKAVPGSVTLATWTENTLEGSESLRVLSELCGDAMAMRAAALNADGSVRNPDLLHRSIKLRCSVLLRAAKAKSTIYDNFRAGAFFGAVLEEVRLEAPEVVHRIVARLRGLSAAMG
jgi:hypothetical protein